MPNMLTGRSRNLKIPKVIEKTVSTANTEDDLFAASQAFSMAADKKFRPREKVLADFDEDMAQVLKIPENSSELVVITKAKKLGAYGHRHNDESRRQSFAAFLSAECRIFAWMRFRIC